MIGIDKIDLQKTFVLDWYSTDSDFVISVDACLLQSHPLYSLPLNGEIGPYRKVKFIFVGIVTISGLLEKSEVSFSLDPDGTKDYGEIETFAVNTCGEIGICGEFGDVVISCKEFNIEYEPSE